MMMTKMLTRTIIRINYFEVHGMWMQTVVCDSSFKAFNRNA